jgi:hypothetical protein
MLGITLKHIIVAVQRNHVRLTLSVFCWWHHVFLFYEVLAIAGRIDRESCLENPVHAV